jgi:hypothetical protein
MAAALEARASATDPGDVAVFIALKPGGAQATYGKP